MRLVSLLLICVSLAAVEPSRVDSIFAPLIDSNAPGAAVLVRKDGRVIVRRGYGVRDLRTMAAIDAQTDFRLASFTKQFTAMAVMLLIHDGKLRYDERLTEIFPDFPEYGRAITIRHLLTHTSGLPDYGELMQSGPWTETNQIQDADVLALLKRTNRPEFAAGTRFAYSNSGYVVLGLIVARASGTPYEQFLAERIFKPLRMSNTVVFVKGKNTVPNRAYGHTKEGAAFVETDQSASSATLGDGGVYSNLDDLARWDEALEKHTLLSASDMQPAWTPAKLDDGSEAHSMSPDGAIRPVSYGFGWFLDPLGARKRMYHSGGTRGFVTMIERFPEEKLTVVVLCNRTDLDPGKLAIQVSEIF